MTVSLSLPALTPDEHTHSAKLIERVRDAIDAGGGWISFERFMEMALYEPGLGYYSAGATKLGPEGDFVTAPEISPLFSRCLAKQCAQVLAEIPDAEILELGAGSGTMAADVLTELAALARLPRRYLILEVSADLRERQRATFAARGGQILARVEWLEQWPEAFRGVIVANEVLDAFPVQRFRIRGDHINTLGITWQLGRLDWSEVRADAGLEQAVRAIEQRLGTSLPDGYTSEINMRLAPWIDSLAKSLEHGVALFIDYGLPEREYYRADRTEGTLLCHFRHRFHDDPLLNVGLQDIGAWVDFTAVAQAASAAGLAVAGFSTQAHFLIGAGIEELLGALASEGLTTARVQLARQAMLLTLPGEMGERFKAIALTRAYDAPLRGFAIRDLAASL
jgi:SAM-dependent MidA family methyltransferase